MQTEVNTESLTAQLKAAKDAKDKLAKLERLCKNRDFKELIIEDYCTNEAARLVQASIDPAHAPDEQKKFLTMAQATGGILLFIRAQERLLTTQVNSIPAVEQALEDMRLEEEQHDDDEGNED